MAGRSRHLAGLNWRYGRTVRWVLAGGCLCLAVVAAGDDADHAPVASLTVAAAPIASGAQLTAADLTTTPSSLSLDTPAPADLVGETVRGPLEPGEPVTRSRIAPGGLVPADPGTVVFPLTLRDERIAALLHAGDRVDVLVTPDALHEGEPRVVVSDVEVLAVPVTESSGLGAASPTSGAVVLIGLPVDDAAIVAGIRSSDHVSVAIR